MTNQVDPDGVSMLYAYNPKGELAYTVLDVDRDYTIDWSGDDRISYVTNDVVNNGTADVRRTRTYVWNTSANSSNLISTVETSADGLRSWNTVWNNGTAITSQSRTVYDAANGYRYVTNTAPDNSYSVAITRYGTNVSQTAIDSTGTQLAQATFAYDSHGRQSTVTDARTGATTFTFNNADQVVTTTTPVPAAGQSAQVTTNYFDNMGRVWKTGLPDGGVVTNDFSLLGQAQTISGARTYASGNGYDAQGRFKSLTNWSGFPSTGARATTWNYDPYRGWLTNKSYPDGTGPSYTYSDAGRLKTRLWARGTNATYIYNNTGDLSATFYSDGTAGTTNGFDRLGRTITVTNGTAVCNYTFTDLGLLLSDSYAGGVLSGLSVTNGYDQFLRRTNLSVLSPSSQLLSSTAYGYDSASRLSSVSSGTNSATYSYLANSPLVSQIFYTNGGTLRMTRSNQFDNLNRLTNLVWTVGSTVVASFAQQFNDANQKTRVTLLDGSYWLYLYDPLGQVSSAKKYWSDGTPVAGQQGTYDFDDIGNREVTASGGDSSGGNLRSAYYTNNNLNQITSRTVPGYVDVLGSATNTATVTVNNQATYRKGDYFRAELTANNTAASLWFGVTNVAVLNNGTNADIVASTTGFVFVAQSPEVFSHDLDGNLTNSGRWAINWDAENRATSFTRSSSAPSNSKLKVDCTYDYRWRRTQKIVSTWNGSAYVAQSTNKFVYDGWNLIAILDATNGLVQSFTWGLDASGSLQGAGGVGGLISMTVHQGTNAGTYLYCYDGNHNVATLVNATNGAVEAVYELDAFLGILRATGRLAFVNPFVGSTKFYDWETGFYYYGYRYYDPSTGKWLSKDPIGENGGINIYGMVFNDPISEIDTDGQGPYDSPLARLWMRLRSRPPQPPAQPTGPDAFQLYREFRDGTSIPNRYFGPYDLMTEQLKRSRLLERHREVLRNKLREICKVKAGGGVLKLEYPEEPLGGELGRLPEAQYLFWEFPTDLVFNPASAFTGSFTDGKITVIFIDCCSSKATIHIHGFNSSSGTSFRRFPPSLGGYDFNNRRPSLYDWFKYPWLRDPQLSWKVGYTGYFPNTLFPDNPNGQNAPLNTTTQTYDWDETLTW